MPTIPNFHVGFAPFTKEIFIGIVNKVGNEWRQKKVATDDICSAVAQFLSVTGIQKKYAIGDKKLVLRADFVKDFENDVCQWLYSNDIDSYITACENAFIFENIPPIDAGYTFCPHCGKKIYLITNEEIEEE